MKKFVITGLLALLVIALALIMGTGGNEADAAWPWPSLHLELDTHPFDMPRTQWQDGTASLTGFTRRGDFEDVAVRIRGRGSSTWYREPGPEKRPLRIRFTDGERTLLGTTYAAQDWILLANQFDPTQLRTYSVFYFVSLLGPSSSFVPMTRFVHLYINQEYVGVYLAIDERDAGQGRMELTWHPNPELSEFFLHYCVRAAYGDGTEGNHYVRVNGRTYEIRFPNSGTRRRAHADYIRSYLYAVSHAIRSRNFNEIERLIDVDSFVDFFIINELFHNLSPNYSSTFMSIQGIGESRRLVMGPVWDFDHGYGGGPERSILYGHMYHEGIIRYSYWYMHLLRVPEFRHALSLRWQALREEGIPQQTIDHLLYMADTYQDHFNRNFTRHPVLGTALPGGHPAQGTLHTFDEQVSWLANWLEARILWLDDFFDDEIPRLFSIELWIAIAKADLILQQADHPYYDEAFGSLALITSQARALLSAPGITQADIDEMIIKVNAAIELR